MSREGHFLFAGRLKPPSLKATWKQKMTAALLLHLFSCQPPPKGIMSEANHPNWITKRTVMQSTVLFFIQHICIATVGILSGLQAGSRIIPPRHYCPGKNNKYFSELRSCIGIALNGLFLTAT